MAIQVRRGLYKDFEPAKMLPGEWAVSIDAETQNQVVWMCFSAGVVKRMGTYEDFVQQITDATADIKDEYMTEFNTVLDSIREVASSVSTDKDIVLQVKSDILEDYIPQIETLASSAEQSAIASANSAVEAQDIVDNIAVSATVAQSYAVGGTGTRESEDVDNAKYYKEQAERISQGLSGALLPMGTITFAQLASQTKQAGYMFNISDAFTTDETFKEGAGLSYPKGTNVYYTTDGFWDCLAGDITDIENRTTILESKVDLAPIDSQAGTSIQTTVADDSKVDITKIEGATTVTPTNPDLDISPDNVATITSAKDFDVVACGKNLIDYTEFKTQGLSWFTSVGGEVLARGSGSHCRFYLLIPSFLYGKTISVSWNILEDTTTFKNIRFRGISSSGQVFYNPIRKAQNIIPLGATDVALEFVLNNTPTQLSEEVTLRLGNVQLELGSTPTTYEPYKSNKLTITKELNKLPNGVADTRERIDNKYVKYTHRIGKEVLDGSETGWFVGSLANRMRIKISNAKASNVALVSIVSDRFQGVPNTSWNKDKEQIELDADSAISIKIDLSRLSVQNVDGFKTWLQANPTTVLYELAEPIETIVEEPSTLTSYKGITNVYTTAMAQPKLTVDFKSRLENTIEEIKSSITPVSIDDELSETSENPVQNKVVTAAVEEIKSNLSPALISESSLLTYNVTDAGRAQSTYWKLGRLVWISTFLYSATNAFTKNIVIATLKTEYRPFADTYYIGKAAVRYGNEFPCTILIKKNGEISVTWQQSGITAIGEISFGVMYST